MNTEYRAACPYCGQVIMLELSLTEDADEASLVNKAGKICKCLEATIQRGMRATEPAIQEMIGEGGQKYFNNVVKNETVETVRGFCESILRGYMNNVTLKIPCGDVIKMALNGNGVRIKRIEKRQMEM